MLTPADLELHVFWASWHQWRAGQTAAQPRIGGHSLWLVASGTIVVRDGSGQWNVNAGEALLWPATRARTVVTPEAAEWISVGLRVSAFGQLDVLERLNPPCQWRPARPEVIRGPIEAMRQHRKPRDEAEALLLDALARTLFLECWRELSELDLPAALDDRLPSWMPAALQAGREQPDVTVRELARLAGISEPHLRREFGKYFSQPPHVFLARQRLDAGRKLLENTDLPVRAVAARAGYASASHFSRVFRQAFGVGPDGYRRGRERGI